MPSKSEKRQEKQKKKRKQKKEQTRQRQMGILRRLNVKLPAVSSSEDAVLYRQVSSQAPVAWAGELPEDVAIFDNEVLATLPAQLAEEAGWVRQGLELACAGQGEQAVQATATIPRSSPYSQWRLFLRGVVAWLAGDFGAAAEAWQRLDAERRPGRMATAMMLSLDGQPASAPSGDSTKSIGLAGSGAEHWEPRSDSVLRTQATLLRRYRFERPALKLAKAVMSTAEEDDELMVGPRKLDWLRLFVTEYSSVEPGLVHELGRIVVARAFTQIYQDLFREACEIFPGPPHDPLHNYLAYLYHDRFSLSEDATNKPSEMYLERYLQQLQNGQVNVSAALRAALLSELHMIQAVQAMHPTLEGMMGLYTVQEVEDPALIRKHLQQAVMACPANPNAHKLYISWLEDKLAVESLKQKEREPLIDEQAKVMQGWAQGTPEHSTPHLWLADYLLDNQRMEEAKTHVDWLAGSRNEDPRVRAAPWKWNLLQAMQFCSRKAKCGEARGQLKLAEELWPAWLSKTWLPYLSAAIGLRSGNTAEFTAERERIWLASAGVRGSLADGCMMLAAAQRMHVPAAALKGLREDVETALNAIWKIDWADLLNVGQFFWDLHRCRIKYPAYRMHGTRIIITAVERFKKEPAWVHDNAGDTRLHSMLLIGAEQRCFKSSESWFYHPQLRCRPPFLAVQLSAFLKQRLRHRYDAPLVIANTLRTVAATEGDAYYRYWYAALADELDEIIANRDFGFSNIPRELQGTFMPFGFSDDDEDWDDDDDE